MAAWSVETINFTTAMPETMPPPAPPIERLAVRICRLANAKGGTDAGPALDSVRAHMNAFNVSAAIKVAIERGWLRRDGATYAITPAGAELGGSRWGKRRRRVMPFRRPHPPAQLGVVGSAAQRHCDLGNSSRKCTLAHKCRAGFPPPNMSFVGSWKPSLEVPQRRSMSCR